MMIDILAKLSFLSNACPPLPSSLELELEESDTFFDLPDDLFGGLIGALKGSSGDFSFLEEWHEEYLEASSFYSTSFFTWAYGLSFSDGSEQNNWYGASFDDLCTVT